jgi:ABC-type multidrug transport system fused ATPase/permease subunit
MFFLIPDSCDGIDRLLIQIKRNGRIAYVSQEPWVMNASIRENILFGEAYDEGRYKAVLGACAFYDDLKQLPAGDQTEIGERGINLSGGQKVILCPFI